MFKELIEELRLEAVPPQGRGKRLMPLTPEQDRIFAAKMKTPEWKAMEKESEKRRNTKKKMYNFGPPVDDEGDTFDSTPGGS